jgi:hypothetical protein
VEVLTLLRNNDKNHEGLDKGVCVMIIRGSSDRKGKKKFPYKVKKVFVTFWLQKEKE